MNLLDPTFRDAGATVPCLSIPTFVRVIGEGPPVVVVHGGPGFSHDHLVAPLRPLAVRRSLVFYDQPGCGRSGGSPEALTPGLVADHLRALLRSFAQPFGLLAHSWGCLVAIEATGGSDESAPKPREGLFVTPAAPTRDGWDASVGRLLARVPPDVVQDFMTKLAAGADVSFDPLLPFYCSKPVAATDAVLAVRGATYLACVDRLGPFDLRAAARRLLPAIDVTVGRDDFTPPEAWRDLAAVARRSTTLDTGHFPFWEDPVGFARVLAQAFA